ncbi:multicopper oxidase family protein [Paenibacillus chibensis]|uniref:multicopper oxidase family protein n=1 Tax=Paenibacillus chibensis TaxID=59846 RepID=UPI000FD8D9CC|nr:multicopper oxidase family protein [Paenibacillus chibensis]MEC0371308.1 multicopper oxidase family protein [Paenibacillus chibensis]
MKSGILKTLVAAGSIAVIATGCVKVNNTDGMDHSKMIMGDASTSNPNKATTSDSNSVKLTSATSVVDGKEFTITAQESNLEVSKGYTLPVWTFNNSVPGPQIRVKVGDTVKVNLKNEMKQPVSIHWHGYPVPNNMDGIPGVTQDAVEPGKTFTYEFKATTPGTYWYHSHQDSVNQVDKGLYGSLIVEDPKDDYDKDYTLMLDEWMSSVDMNMSGKTEESNSANMDRTHDSSGMDKGNMIHGEMDMSGSDMKMNGSSMNMSGHDMSMYDLYTINGKSGESIDPFPVKEGDKVRIRLINAGFITHQMHLHGHDFKVISTDGQPVNDPAVIQDQLLSIAPGERYDIEFTADNPGSWLLEEHGKEPSKIQNMKAVIQYQGSDVKTDQSNATDTLPLFDLEQYGRMSKAKFSLSQKFDQEVTLNLNTEMKNGEMAYTINGKVFPDTDKINVKKGDKVKVTFVNKSNSDDHPMHLHGHFFQVLSKNGQPYQGSPIMKDTINVKPGETYEVAFEADNPGDWMFHCHDLHHASAGMVTDVMYSDYQSSYTPDPNVENIPE